jgi:ferrous iron transport protein B
MSCATKITIYGFFVAAFFPGQGGIIMTGLYLLGILVGIVTAHVFRHTVFKGDAAPFVMELPNYRMPSARSLGRLVWDKMKDFITRAFTVIFIATIVVWFLSHFDLTLAMVDENSESSMLALLAGWMAPIFAPLGFGDWRIVTSLIAGFMAKETVVATLTVLFGSTAQLLATITPLAAIALLVFCLLYTPCVAAIACVNRELGTKWAIYIVIFQCLVAWVCAFIVHGVGLLLGFA